MRFRFWKSGLAAAVASGAAWLALAAGPARADGVYLLQPRAGCCEPCPPFVPGVMMPGTPGMPVTPGTPTPTTTTPVTTAAPGTEVARPFTQASQALGGDVFGPAYLDSAVPRNVIRLRFDAAYDNNRPDRAEFFYPKCGCFKFARPPAFDPKAAGPERPETNVDYQEFSLYTEWALGSRFSTFGEVPIRLINPDVNDNQSGFGDINAGFKFAALATDRTVASFQMRTYLPTGDARKGLGTNHVSLEPGLLVYHRLAERLYLDAEVKDWIPIGGSDFAGNVIRYGLGLTYVVPLSERLRLMPVGEVVGWTVLGGKEAGVNTVIQDAAGDTIVNAKAGVRVGFGQLSQPGFLNRSDLYIGYGRALTGEVWYKDLFRIEYRLAY